MDKYGFLTGYKAISLICVFFVFTSGQAAFKIQKVTSPNGVSAWLVEDHSVPVVSLSVSFKGGAVQDPLTKEGLTDLLCHLLDEGAGPYDGEQFNAQLQENSIELAFNASYNYINANLRTTSSRLGKACMLLKLALTQPRLAQKEVEKLRSSSISFLKNREKIPKTIADKTFRTQFMVPHPYGRPLNGTEQSLSKITMPDLKSLVKTGFTRDRLIIGVCGDITPNQLAQMLDDTFKDLPLGSAFAEIPVLSLPKAGRTIVVQADFPQSYVLFGCNGVDYRHPDYTKLELLNYVLGGGFTSRLVNEIRVKRGNAYSLSTMLQNYQQGFFLLGFIGSDNERVLESVQLVKDVWTQIKSQGITATELKEAKLNLKGQYILNLSTSSKITAFLNDEQKKGRSPDFYETYEKILQEMTLDQINAFARTFLNADELNFVIVGNPKTVPLY